MFRNLDGGPTLARVRAPYAVLILILLLVLQAGGARAQSPGATPEPWPRLYEGTLVGAIRTQQDCDQDGVSDVSEQPFSVPVKVILSDPVADDVTAEANPWNLLVMPLDHDGLGRVGETWIQSGSLVDVPAIGRQVLQFWSITQDAPGGTITAVLTDPHEESGGSTFNTFWDDDDVSPCIDGTVTMRPFAVAEGATIAGVLDPDVAHLQFVLTSSDLSRTLTAQLDATRNP